LHISSIILIILIYFTILNNIKVLHAKKRLKIKKEKGIKYIIPLNNNRRKL